jgi:hypothetical protein
MGTMDDENIDETLMLLYFLLVLGSTQVLSHG